MMNYILAILLVIALMIVGELCFKNSIQDQIRKRLKEDEKKSKDAERKKQQLRDEDKYDGNYKKRHS